MSGNLSSRVERRFLEIEGRLRESELKKRGNTVIQMPHSEESISYVNDQIDQYEFYLTEIMRNVKLARAKAPCGGCKKTIESIKIVTLGSLTALAVFKAMSSEDRKRGDFSDEEIERIKKEVEQRYAKY